VKVMIDFMLVLCSSNMRDYRLGFTYKQRCMFPFHELLCNIQCTSALRKTKAKDSCSLWGSLKQQFRGQCHCYVTH